MLKKILASLLCTVLLCSCGANSASEKESTTINESTSSASTEEGSTNVADTTVEATALAADQYSTEKVVWGPGNITEHQRPTDPLNLQKQYEKLGAKFILDDKKTIALTFDEGYENGYTPSILDTLKEKEVKAVFFVTYDFVRDNPQLIKRMLDEGHVVGNHTYRHYTMDEVSLEEATREIVYLHEYIKENYKYEMKYFRFPKGEFSESTLALAQSLGYESIFWSFAYADWDTDNVTAPDVALKAVTDSLHNGAIYLLHAVSPTNSEILGDFIENARAQGYEFTVNL